MNYKKFLKIRKFINKTNRNLILFSYIPPHLTVNKAYKSAYYRLIKFSNYLMFFKIYKFSKFRSYTHFWKYYKSSTIRRAFYFLKVYKNYTLFFFSYRVRNLFCIIWQKSNIETFFSSYIIQNNQSRTSFLPQLKIVRYLIYVYFLEFKSTLKLHFVDFSVKIKYIIKIFFHWMVFHRRVFRSNKKFDINFIEINHKIKDLRIKKRRYPVKKRYLQRKSRSGKFMF